VLDRIQCFFYKKSTVVVTLGCCMGARLVQDGVNPSRVQLIRTWAEDELVDTAITATEARKRQGIPERFTVMYSGYAGAWHDFNPILEALDLLAGFGQRVGLTHHHPPIDVQFLFCGLGPGIDRIRHWCDLHPEIPVLFRPLVPTEQRITSLCCGDIHLVALKAQMLGTCSPSKLNPLLALGRPLIAIAPLSSQLAEDVVSTGAGFCTETGSGLLEAIQRFRQDPDFPEPYATAAREAFRSRHSKQSATKEWLNCLEGAYGLNSMTTP
jgi:hypothetical protein